MVITNQIVRATITETKKIPAIPEIKPVVNIQENKVLPVIAESIIKPVISRSVINVNLVEAPVHVSIPVGVPGVKGDKGDTGASGALSSYSYIAGEALGGHRGIVIDNNIAYHADNTNLNHINKPIGISSNSSSLGGNVTVVFFGELEEVSWNWDITKPIFIGTNGLLTQIPTISGFSCIIATPITTTKIFIEKQEIFIL